MNEGSFVYDDDDVYMDDEDVSVQLCPPSTPKYAFHSDVEHTDSHYCHEHRGRRRSSAHDKIEALNRHFRSVLSPKTFNSMNSERVGSKSSVCRYCKLNGAKTAQTSSEQKLNLMKLYENRHKSPPSRATNRIRYITRVYVIRII